MKNTNIFIKRNLIEMLRDPLLYVMCIIFPFLMFILFTIINKSIPTVNPTFDVKALTPGIMVFAYSFLALMASLLISKDKSTAFLKRLYTSPMKSYNFFLGYFIPFLIIGLIQNIVCLLSGFIFSLIQGVSYVSLLNSLILILVMFPIMITNISIGIILGTLMNEKSAPGVSSVMISSSGILGGCWMPIETMGGFYSFAKILPFYPSVALGKIFSNAEYMKIDNNETIIAKYSFNEVGNLGLILIITYMIVSTLIAVYSFSKLMHKD